MYSTKCYTLSRGLMTSNISLHSRRTEEIQYVECSTEGFDAT